MFIKKGNTFKYIRYDMFVFDTNIVLCRYDNICGDCNILFWASLIIIIRWQKVSVSPHFQDGKTGSTFLIKNTITWWRNMRRINLNSASTLGMEGKNLIKSWQDIYFSWSYLSASKICLIRVFWFLWISFLALFLLLFVAKPT